MGRRRAYVDNEKTKTELETLKLSQKFLVRQPCSGRIPVEKMDLMNTVNQLLVELNKIKGEKVSLEEELKAQKRAQVRDRITRTVTARDVEMAASSKVKDTELASKLAKARLQHLGLQDSSTNSRGTPNHDDYSSLTTKPIAAISSDSPSDFLHGGLQGTQSLAIPSRDELMNCAAIYAHSLPSKVGGCTT